MTGERVKDMEIWEKLQAMEEIRCVKAAYFRTVDTKQWPEFKALFTQDAVIHYPESGMGPMDLETAYTHVVSSLTNAVSIHHGHMPEIKMHSPDDATAIWAMEDEVYLPGDPDKGVPDTKIVGAGHYHERYRRENGTWKIASLLLTRVHHEMIQTRVRSVILGS